MMQIWCYLLLSVYTFVIYANARELKIHIDPSIELEVSQHPTIESDLKELIDNASQFYQIQLPEFAPLIPEQLEVEIVPLLDDGSLMAVQFPSNQLSISWTKIKKWLYVANEEQDPRVLRYNKTHLSTIAAHELSHIIHNASFLKLDFEQLNSERQDAKNIENREFLASMLETLYLIYEKGLPWVYKHHATFYLNNDGLPPFSKNILGDYAYGGIHRRWSVFSLIMMKTQCWSWENGKVSLLWGETLMAQCLEEKSSKIITELNSWVHAAFQNSEFTPLNILNSELHMNTIDEVFIYADDILNQIIDLSLVKIKSAVYPVFPIFTLNDFIQSTKPLLIDSQRITSLADGWYLFRYHHLKGMFNPQKTNLYKIL
jgi:hypothetical protein